MNKDEQIQQLREQLARAEGERDAYRAIANRRPEVVTTPYTSQPYVWPTPGYVCASCGRWATGPHNCWTWANPLSYTVSTQSVSSAVPIFGNFFANVAGSGG